MPPRNSAKVKHEMEDPAGHHPSLCSAPGRNGLFFYYFFFSLHVACVPANEKGKKTFINWGQHVAAVDLFCIFGLLVFFSECWFHPHSIPSTTGAIKELMHFCWGGYNWRNKFQSCKNKTSFFRFFKFTFGSLVFQVLVLPKSNSWTRIRGGTRLCARAQQQESETGPPLPSCYALG